MSEEIKTILAEIKEDIESLKDRLSKFAPHVPQDAWPESLDIAQAQTILGRKRSWINKRMTTAARVAPGTDVTELLVYGEDWYREGLKIVFKRDSILRLKNVVMRNMGDRYQRKSEAMYS